MVRLSFSDDGPGILQKNIIHVFDPFFTTKEVVRNRSWPEHMLRIVTNHNGRIHVKSELGSGATL